LKKINPHLTANNPEQPPWVSYSRAASSSRRLLVENSSRRERESEREKYRECPLIKIISIQSFSGIDLHSPTFFALHWCHSLEWEQGWQRKTNHWPAGGRAVAAGPPVQSDSEYNIVRAHTQNTLTSVWQPTFTQICTCSLTHTHTHTHNTPLSPDSLSHTFSLTHRVRRTHW
jgi:hypothetical protein